MNTCAKRKGNTGGFTLIEMIGVLAVIAILASLLIPKIFEAIDNARVNNAAITCSTIKTAVADHYAKFGGLAVDGTLTPPGVFAPGPDYDVLLLQEGFLDKPFAVKIGAEAGTDVLLTDASTFTAGTVVAAGNGAYDLDGDGANDVVGSAVVESVIVTVEEKDAKALNDRIDGTTLGSVIPTVGGDLLGRVKYGVSGTGTGGTGVDVRVYMTHR